MFPSGRPGIALVIVRLCLVGMLLLHAYRFGPMVSLSWSMPVLVLIAIALCVGVVTAIASMLYCVAEVAFLLTVTGFDATVLMISIPVAIALVLLGPGAYSLDARMFGRRVIVLPPDNDTQRR
jgi:hypothetical protein